MILGDEYRLIQKMQQKNDASGNFVEEEYSVPDEMAGLIIGRGGEQVKRLQAETGCKVKISPRSKGDPNRRCTLTGSRDAIEAVKSRIEQIISQFGLHVIEIMIPGHKVGRLIGKGGENLKDLQEKCGVKMVVIQDGPQPTTFAKPLRISGDQENVEFAEKVVEDFLAQIYTKGSQVAFASRPVYRDDLTSKPEQGDGNFLFWLFVVLFLLFVGSLSRS